MSAHTWIRIGDIAFIVAVVALAVVVGWRALNKSVEPVALAFKWIITVAMILGTVMFLPHVGTLLWPVIVLIPAMTVGMLWAPSLGDLVARILSGGMVGGAELEPQPFYSMAEAKRRNSHPQEAIQAVREQLEKFPNDFPGVMLVATIQAEDLNDLSGAQATLEHWIESPKATPQGTASALNTIADWHLQYAQDPDTARACFEKIIDRFPDTPIAHRAAQRLANLPTLEHLLNTTNAKTLNLRPVEKNIGLRKIYIAPVAADADPAALADGYVKQLEQHPSDTGTREKLAVLYAESFNRLDLAVDQLEQLINYPNESPKNVAHWLHLLADLQIRVAHDEAAAEAALRRIVEMFSTPALVEPAMVRIASLHKEMRAGETNRVKALGQYEKNLGLKQTGVKSAL